MALAVAITLAMCALSYLFMPDNRLQGGLGICLPSPNEWNIIPLWSAAANTVLLLAMTAGLYFLNKHFNFVKTTDNVLTAAFLVMIASNPWITRGINASLLVCCFNMVACVLMFDTYKKSNATQELFIVATFLSVGSMAQYAFLPYIPAYVVAAIIMKVFRLREMTAFILGLAAPYWVGVGLGLIPLSNFSIPELSNLFYDFAPPTDFFILLLNLGVTILWSFVASMNVLFKLYAGNSRVLAMNNIIGMLGLVSVIGIVADFNNMIAYCATLYLSAAAVTANVFALWPIRRAWIPLLIMTLLYIASFTLTLTV